MYRKSINILINVPVVSYYTLYKDGRTPKNHGVHHKNAGFREGPGVVLTSSGRAHIQILNS